MAELPAVKVVAPARTVDTVKPKVGDIVWAGVTNAPAPDLVQVEKIEGSLITYERLTATMMALDTEKKAQYVEPYGGDFAPFSYVAAKSGDGWRLILVLGVDGDSVYGQSGDDLVTAKKSDVKPLKAAWKDRKKGDSVIAFDSGGNGQVGKIDTVPMAKWVFTVSYMSYPWNMVFDAP